jgi:DHA1 family multidrug resistance protein-like MFS transporter
MKAWRKNLYNIWTAQFLAMIGMSMVIPFLPFYIRELGVTNPDELETWSGIVFAGPFILSFLLTPVWGALGDRFGKKTMVLRAIFGLAVSQLLIGLSADVYQLFIFRMLQGAVSGFIAASLGLVSSGTPKEKSGYAIGILQTSISAGTVIGPLIGGFLSDTTSHSNVFFITAGMCLISGVLVLINVKEPRFEKPAKVYNVVENYKYVFKQPNVVTPLIAITLVQVCVSMAQPVFALFIESFNMETEYLSTVAGSIFGLTGVATVISSPWWGKRNDSKGFRKNLMVAMSGAAAAFMLHAAVTNVYYLYPVRAFLGFCIGGIVPVLYSYISKHADDERKGGVMGIASSFTLFGNMLGPLICTALTFHFHLHYIFLISGLLMAAACAFVNRRLIDYRQESAPVISTKDADITAEGMAIAAGNKCFKLKHSYNRKKEKPAQSLGESDG